PCGTSQKRGIFQPRKLRNAYRCGAGAGCRIDKMWWAPLHREEQERAALGGAFSSCGKKRESTNGIFPQLETSKPVLPKLETSLVEDLYDELELIGFPVSSTMFELTKSPYRGNAVAPDLPALEGKTVRMVGDFVTDKTVRTKYGDYMKFGTFLDANGDFFDTVHFSKSLKAYPLRGNGIYLIEGKVVMEFGCPALEVQKAGRMPLKVDPRGG